MTWLGVYSKAGPAQSEEQKIYVHIERSRGIRFRIKKRQHPITPKLSNLARTSTSLNSSNQPISPVKCVIVGGREAALLRDLDGAGPAQDVTHVAGEALLVAVEVRHDGAVDVVKDIVLGQHLGAHAAVDARRWAVLEHRVEDVARAEAQGGQPGADVDEAVVVVGYAELACVLLCVTV